MNQEMEIKIQEKALNLKYQTNIFLYGYRVERAKFDEEKKEWKSKFIKRKALTQVNTKLALTHRESLPNEYGTEKKPKWYVVYLDHSNNLNPDGTYKYVHDRPMHLDMITFPYTEKNITPEIEKMIREAFPDHNVGLNMKLTNAVDSATKKGDRMTDIRDIYRPLIKQITEYVIQQGLNEISK
ncbi:hypothetical protein KY348_02035 [Candidatus Woesearchaeota archaeon]|nr:hypothetical protein [Candidatus Woesearchaeota archaeon]